MSKIKDGDDVFTSQDVLDYQFTDAASSSSELEFGQDASKFINNPFVTIRRILHMYG
jgi:hypothetical protein